MASIERTAYPRCKRTPTAQNLHALYTPTPDEIAFAQKAALPFQHQLSLLVLLKSFQRLGYFPKLDEVPAVIVQHVRNCLSLREQITPGYEAPRTLYRHHQLIHEHLRVIAYHHVADSYVALFSHFIPCGTWEAIYIIEGLLQNAAEIQPETVHADTQGQSAPVFALAHLLGIKLMPRIRN